MLTALVLAGVFGAASGRVSSAELGAPSTSEQAADSPRRPQSTVPAEPAMTLAGTIISPTVRRALIAHSDSGAVAHVAEGETVAGWQFEKVLSDGVILRHNNQRIELKLRDSLPAQSGAATAMPIAASGPATQEMTGVMEPGEAESAYLAVHGIKSSR
jgi:hypothetical protein